MKTISPWNSLRCWAVSATRFSKKPMRSWACSTSTPMLEAATLQRTRSCWTDLPEPVCNSRSIHAWRGGMDLEDVCRDLGIAESTWHRWVAQYGGMKANDAKRLKELEGENSRLKKLLAEAELDKLMLKEIAEGNF